MGRDDFTDMGGTGQAFLTTHWSLIEEAGSSEADRNRALIGLLMNRYWKPVYCYLRHKGYNNADAKDLTQGFFHEVVLERHLVDKADAAKGRFRTFLLTALDYYLVNVRESQSAQKRKPKGKLVSLDAIEPLDLPATMAGSAPEDTFDYAWISALLQRVVEQVEARCHEDDKTVHWYVFRDRVLRPIVERTPAPELTELCAKYGVTDQSQASNMIVTVKRRFQMALREKLRESVTSEEHMQDEINEIRRFFPKIAQENG